MRKLRFIVALFLLIPSIGRAANTFVQENHSTSALTGATVSLAYSSNVTTGDLLVTSLRWGTPTNAVNSVTDGMGVGNVWVVIGNTTFGSGVGGATAYTFAKGTGACTVSWNLAGSSPGEVISIGEWSGPTVLRGISDSHTYTTQTVLTSDGVASKSGNLLIGLFQILNGSTTTVTPGGSFNLRSSGTSGGSTFVAITDNLNATSGAQTASITVTGTQNGSAAGIAVFGDPFSDGMYPYPYTLPIQGAVATGNVCTFANNVTSGNYMIVGSSWFSSANAPSVSDTRSTSYTQKGYSSAGAGGIGGLIYAGTLGSSGANAVTISISGASSQQVYCYEFPPSFSLTLDGSADTTSYSNNPSTIAGGNVTTTKSAGVLVSIVGGLHNASVCGASIGYMPLGLQNNSDGGCMEYQITGAPGTYTGSFTNFNNMDQGIIVTVVFKANTMHITTPLAIPDGALTKSYDYIMGAAGAVSTITWTGTPPPGLSLNSSTGEITGTPTISNNYSFSIAASDGTTTDTQTMTMKVATSANTISVVQSQAQSSVGNPSLAFGSNVTIGNTLVVFAGDIVSTFFGAGPMICTDTRSTVYNRVTLSDPTAGANALQVFIGKALSSGADTVTCGGPSGASSNVGGIAELANVQNYGDFWNGLNNSTASPISSFSLTTPVPNSIVLCLGAGVTSATSLTSSAPFTGIGSAQNFIGAYDITTTVTGYSCSYTMSGNTDGRWGIQALALRPSMGAVVPPTTGFPMVIKYRITPDKKIPWDNRKRKLGIVVI